MRIAFYAGGIYLFLNLFALLVSDLLIFVPQAPGYARLPGEVKIATASGEKITAVYHKNPNAEYTLLFSHGNAEDLANVAPFMEQFFDLGYSVLMYDYRGYGTSEGSPSVRKAKQDVSAAYRWLVEEKEVAPKSIIAHGRSLGGGVATWLAANHEVGGLVVESTFVSTIRVKTRWPMLPWDKFNSLKSIPNVDCPVLVMHGRNDTIIPFWHGQKLFAAAPEPRQHLWIDSAGHNDYAYTAGEAYLKSFQSFMEQVSEYHRAASR
ncbi:MAG: alpha/beta hydrolase [Verrucomicrobiota bacterium]|nr:alpha/beta hydrolase [Verrucomicrobiota bacterium]